MTAIDRHGELDQSAVNERFAAIVEAFSGLEGVTLGSGRRGFGSDALCAGGRIFAAPRPDGLLLKLPSQRVAQLVASGAGMPFDAGKGKPMKEWVVVRLVAEQQWLQLARDARAFVTPAAEA